MDFQHIIIHLFLVIAVKVEYYVPDYLIFTVFRYEYIFIRLLLFKYPVQATDFPQFKASREILLCCESLYNAGPV